MVKSGGQAEGCFRFSEEVWLCFPLSSHPLTGMHVSATSLGARRESVTWAQRGCVPSAVSLHPGEVPRVRPRFLTTQVLPTVHSSPESKGNIWWPPEEVKCSDTEQWVLVSRGPRYDSQPYRFQTTRLDRLWMGLFLRLTMYKGGIISMVALGLCVRNVKHLTHCWV